jgi:hypothetical protein
LLYLRVRHYSSADGRFTSRDTWSGDTNRPLSLNRWVYVEGNPVNFADPSGFAKTVLFYFPGFGNKGDINENGLFDFDELDQGDLDDALLKLNNVDVVPIYPYSTGVMNGVSGDLTRWNQVIIPASMGSTNITDAKAITILDELQQRYDLDLCLSSEAPNTWYGIDAKIVFMAYSAGGQIAYTTAQKLTGKLFVDKMILLGSPYHAYNGTANIGELWEIWGEHDLDGDLTYTGFMSALGGNISNLMGWQAINSGMFTNSGNATRCVFSNHNDKNYHHGAYLYGAGQDAGVHCFGKYTYDRGRQKGIDRLDALMDLIQNVIGVGK